MAGDGGCVLAAGRAGGTTQVAAHEPQKGNPAAVQQQQPSNAIERRQQQPLRLLSFYPRLPYQHLQDLVHRHGSSLPGGAPELSDAAGANLGVGAGLAQAQQRVPLPLPLTRQQPLRAYSPVKVHPGLQLLKAECFPSILGLY